MSGDYLKLYAKVSRTQALGCFNRFAIWVQGCPFRCVGCMTPDSLPLEGGDTITIKALADEILATADIEGLTITGGEPFLQAQSLTLLIQQVRLQRDIGVIVYSGYEFKALQRQAQRNLAIAELLACIDLLIDGQFIESLNDGLSLRGSANQQVYALTERYIDKLHLYGQTQRQVEIHLQAKQMMVVGIAGQQFLQQWQAMNES